MVGLEQIQNRAQWACNSHTLHLFDIAFAEIVDYIPLYRTSDLPANCQYAVRALAHEAEPRRVTA